MASITLGKQAFKKAGILLIWLVIWQLLYLAVRQELLLASPLAVLGRILQLSAMREFWSTAAWSLSRIMSGYLLGLAAGAAAAFAAARFSFIDALLELPMKVIQSTPVASFVILALVWISRERLSPFIAFLMVTPMVWSNMREGIRSVDVKLLEMARVFKVGRMAVFRNITVPAVLPYFLSAARTGIGFAWKSGIAGEVIAIPAGAVGTQLYNSKIYLETTDLFAWTVVIIILSVLLERVMVLLIERLAKRLGALSREVGK